MLSNNGKNIEAFKKVLVDLEYEPVVHPYIAEKELDVFPQFNKLIEEGFIRKAEYSEFIEDEDDAELYEQYFPELYEEMREYLEIKGSNDIHISSSWYEFGRRSHDIGGLFYEITDHSFRGWRY